MSLKLITPAAVEPITLTEAKAHLKVDHTDDDILITSLIVAAREHAEGFQNRALVTQTWELVLDAWPRGDSIDMPLPPLQSVTSIKYKDTEGVESTWAATNYIVDIDSFKGRVALAYGISWPSESLYPVGAIRIRFVAGYGLAVSVPEMTKAALKFGVQLNYDALKTDERKQIENARDVLLALNRVTPI